jgi:formylglycine-generating enzyme required for sulfatase activity
MPVRPVAVIVVTAVATASGLARVASGLDTAARSALAPVPAAVPAAAPPAVGAASTAVPREDVEPEEPHLAGTVENPYEEPKEARAAFARQTVPARDGMLRLPGGRFVMGSASSRSPVNEHPTRTVVVTPFWMDRTEVTVGAYRACVDARACARPARSSASCTYDAGEDELPVSCVHWRDAEAYCHFAGKRLPSEREWEYAARGPYAVPFPWGGSGSSCGIAVTLISDLTGRTCAPRPAKVGAHPAGASVFGVLDLTGNVEEWTADWYVESLGPGPAPRAGAAHVLRGGGWLSAPAVSRTTSRNWGSALEAGPNVGFRCVRDAD